MTKKYIFWPMILVLISLIFVNYAHSSLKERMASRKPEINKLKQEMMIVENDSGYLAAVDTSAEVVKLVNEQNADRKILYKAIAAKKNSSIELVEKRAAKMLKRKDETGSYRKPSNAGSSQKTINVLEGIPGNIAETIKSKCSAKWSDDFAMQNYCRKKQAEAWRSMN